MGTRAPRAVMDASIMGMFPPDGEFLRSAVASVVMVIAGWPHVVATAEGKTRRTDQGHLC